MNLFMFNHLISSLRAWSEFLGRQGASRRSSFQALGRRYHDAAQPLVSGRGLEPQQHVPGVEGAPRHKDARMRNGGHL